MRSPFLRGQGRDLLQPAAPVTGWITHGSVQETCQLLKAAVKHFAPHLKKMPSGLHFDKEGKSVSLYCGAVHYTQPTWAERHSKAKRWGWVGIRVSRLKSISLLMLSYGCMMILKKEEIFRKTSISWWSTEVSCCLGCHTTPASRKLSHFCAAASWGLSKAFRVAAPSCNKHLSPWYCPASIIPPSWSQHNVN